MSHDFDITSERSFDPGENLGRLVQWLLHTSSLFCRDDSEVNERMQMGQHSVSRWTVCRLGVESGGPLECSLVFLGPLPVGDVVLNLVRVMMFSPLTFVHWFPAILNVLSYRTRKGISCW